jgi:hypothetical protein
VRTVSSGSRYTLIDTVSLAHPPLRAFVRSNCAQHAYSVLDATDAPLRCGGCGHNGFARSFCCSARIVKVRNPWASDVEWRGAFADDSCAWTSEAKRSVNFHAADDGTWWMPGHDFQRFFEQVWISAIRTGWHHPIATHFQVDLGRPHVAAHFTLAVGTSVLTPRIVSTAAAPGAEDEVQGEEKWKVRSRDDGGSAYMYLDSGATQWARPATRLSSWGGAAAAAPPAAADREGLDGLESGAGDRTSAPAVDDSVRAFVSIARRDTGSHGEHRDLVRSV